LQCEYKKMYGDGLVAAYVHCQPYKEDCINKLITKLLAEKKATNKTKQKAFN